MAKPVPASAETATITVDAEMTGSNLSAQLVRFDIPAPTDALVATEPDYRINMCLTPRPLGARACYRQRTERIPK